MLIQRGAALLVCLAALGVAAPAESATVSKLRVGQHPGFTRVVFEAPRQKKIALRARQGVRTSAVQNLHPHGR